MKKYIILLFCSIALVCAYGAIAANNKTLPKDYDLLFLELPNVLNSKWAATLLYENGTLKKDPQLYSFIKRVPAKYIISNDSSVGAHKGEVVDWKNAVVGTFYFRPEEIKKEAGGSIVVHMPYYPTGTTIKIYDLKGEHLFDINVRFGSTCNMDGVCDDGTFESYASCPTDCEPCIENGVCVPEYGEKPALCAKDCPLPPKITTPPQGAPGNQNTTTSLQDKLFSWWIVAAVIAALIGIGVTAYLMLRTKKTDQEDE